MGFKSNLREKSLLVKEKWPIVLTRLPSFAIVTLLMPKSFAPRPGYRCAAHAASAWWWYRASTEEASALA